MSLKKKNAIGHFLSKNKLSRNQARKGWEVRRQGGRQVRRRAGGKAGSGLASGERGPRKAE